MSALFHQGQPSRLKVLDAEIVTVGTSAVGLSPEQNGDILGVFIEVQGSAVRWMAVGDPTSTAGHYLAAGDAAMLHVPPSQLRFIRDSSASSDATLVVDYLGV